MKRLLTLIAAVAILLAWTSVDTQAHVPPGNDGGTCHGANRASCRPDPQPSHGQDCDPHGNNHDGNDDHCGSPTPSTTPSQQPSQQPSSEPSSEPSATPSPSASTPPSTEPSSEPSASTTGTPAATPSGADTGGGPTPPPTDTADASQQIDWRVALIVFLAIVLLADAVLIVSKDLRK